MKQLFKTGKKQFVVDEVPAPLMESNEIQIEVYSSLISSGTETMGVKKNGASKSGKISSLVSNFERGYNFLLEKGATELLRKLEARDNISTTSGYSVAGVVKSVGSEIKEFKPGDRVAAAGSGIASHAEVVCIPKNLVVKIPEKVSFKEAAFTTIGSIAMQGVRQGKVAVGESVVVIGLGLIGNIAAQILKSSGCRVIGVDLSEGKVNLAKELGVHDGLIASENTVVNDVMKLTGNIGADAVLIYAASASSSIVNEAMQMVRKKGRVVVIGAVGMDINRSPFYEKEVDFTISSSYGPGRYDDDYEIKGIDYPVAFVRWTENRNMQSFLWLLENKMINVENLITDEFDIGDAVKAYEKILTSPGDTLAVVLNYPSKNDDRKFESTVVLSEMPVLRKKEVVNISIIGAGGFASRTYLPAIYKMNDINLRGIATKTGKSAKKIAADFKADFCTTDYSEILKDSSTEAVIIASRHNQHFEMAKNSLEAGKHVLVEKPLALKREELKILSETAKNKRLLLGVGYNRRYSPLTRKIKEALSKELGPVLINYRVNAGFIPAESWVQDREIGGGRIIGEVCHFYDFINFLIKDELVEFTAQKIDANSSTVVSNDNFTSSLKFKNGSMGIVTYTSLGHKELSKEYIEIFVNGKSIVLDDFSSLSFFGFNRKNVELKFQNKGQTEQLVEFIKAVKGETSDFITIDDSVFATRIAIEIDDILG